MPVDASHIPVRRPPAGRKAVLILLLGVALYVCGLLAGGVEPETRPRLLYAWTLAACGVLAIAAPHRLFPDPSLRLLRHLNPTPARLLAYQFGRWAPIAVGLLLPGLVLAFFDPAGFTRDLAFKARALLVTLPAVLAVGVYSFAHYVTIGPVSQAWQEGRRSAFYDWLQEHSTTPLALPDGLVPAFMATGLVFLVGVATLMAGIYVERLAGPWAAVLPGLVLLAYAGFRLARLRPVYDRYFYQTNALYSELFRRGHRLSTMDAAPLPFAGVYWVPNRWRAHAWAGLLQLDRALPLGRYVLLGHVLIWATGLWADAPTYLTAFLVLLTVGKNAAVFALGAPAAAPPAFQLHLQAPTDWVVTRAFVNLRWTFPLLLSLLGLTAFTGALPYSDAFLWTGVDVLAAILFAWLVTYGTEHAYRRRFA